MAGPLFLTPGGGAAGPTRLSIHELSSAEPLEYAALSSNRFDDWTALLSPGSAGSLGAHLLSASRGLIISAAQRPETPSPSEKVVKLLKELGSWMACVPSSKGRGVTMNASFILLAYRTRLRVCICSGDLRAEEWVQNTSTVFVQDFPLASSPQASPFGAHPRRESSRI